MINQPENIYSYLFSCLLVLQAFILGLWASSMPVASAYEGEIIATAEQMVESGKWFLPGPEEESPLFSSSLLPYWLAAAGHLVFPWKLLGFRILNILIYLAALWGFFISIRKYLDARTAFFSCCVLSSSLPFLWQMQLATPDSLGALFSCGVVFGFYLLLKTNKMHFFWLLYGSMAAGLLVKGLYFLILPVLIMVLYLMFRIKFNKLVISKLMPAKGILLVLLICFPWLAFAGLKNKEGWLENFLNRFQGQEIVVGKLAAEGGFYLPWLFVILMIIPFGIFLPRSFTFAWKNRHKKDILLLSSLSLIMVLVFHSFSNTFYPHDLLPALPFTAILLAYSFSSRAGRTIFKMKMNVEMVLLLLAAIVLPLLCWYFLSSIGMGEKSAPLFLSVLLLSSLPIGSLLTVSFWMNKRTEAGFICLTLSYLSFFVLLIHLTQSDPSLATFLQTFIF